MYAEAYLRDGIYMEKIINGRIMLSSNFTVCNSKKSRFSKEDEASGIISRLAKAWSNIAFVGPVFFILKV